GPASARNRGIRAAQCRRVAFLDADEEWHPDKLWAVLTVWEEWPDVKVFGHRRVWSSSAGALDEWRTSRISKPGNIRLLLKRDFLRRNPLPTSSVVMERSLGTIFPSGQRRAEDFG